MKYTCLLFVCMLSCASVFAQKVFTEGVITYSIRLEPAGQPAMTGKYIFTIKGMEIKKEVVLSTGYQNTTLINGSTGTAHLLQNKEGKNYAIELSMAELAQKQDKYNGYTLNDQQANSRNIAGIPATRTNIKFRDGSSSELYYTADWMPPLSITFEHFPNAKFLPLSFRYTENGLSISMLADKVEPGPVENSVFRIPHDFMMISYKEYKELSQK